MERIRLDEEPILKIGRSLITALGFESLSLRISGNSICLDFIKIVIISYKLPRIICFNYEEPIS